MKSKFRSPWLPSAACLIAANLFSPGTLFAGDAEPVVDRSAMKVVEAFNQENYIGPGVKVPDGYIDGGRGMKLDAGNQASSDREILLLDRVHDEALAADLAFARSAELRALPPIERADRIAVHIDHETTLPGGDDPTEAAVDQMANKFTDRAVMLGAWIDQCHAGVCRHRSLLFKVLADEAGLKTALVRGNYHDGGSPVGGHAWNELFLDDGRRVLVDVMMKHDRQTYPDLTSPEVVEHYCKVDDEPWYSAPTTAIPVGAARVQVGGISAFAMDVDGVAKADLHPGPGLHTGHNTIINLSAKKPEGVFKEPAYAGKPRYADDPRGSYLDS